jgi:hypothetical protein
VVLTEPAAGGHRWRLTEAPDQVALVSERYRRFREEAIDQWIQQIEQPPLRT